MEQGKVCTKCEEWKVFSDFTKIKGCKDGYRPICKECVNKDARLRLLNDEEYAKRKREGEKERRIKRIENDPNYRKRENKINNENRKIRRADCDYRESEYKRDNARNRERYANDTLYREKISKRCKVFSRTEKGVESSRKAKRKYKSSEKGKQSKEREIKSEAFKLRLKKYRQSEKGKTTLKASYYKNNMKRRSNKNYVKFTPHDRIQLLERDNWTCQCCGIKVHDRSTGNWNTPDKAHIDHIIPISKGGNSEPNNLQILCRTCNLSKSDKVEYINQAN